MSFFSFLSIKNSHNCFHVSIASRATVDCPTFSWRCVTVTFSCQHDTNLRVIWEEGTSAEVLPPTDWPVDMSEKHVLKCQLMEEA